MSLMKRMSHTAIACSIPKIVTALEKLFTPDPEPTQIPYTPPAFDTVEHELIATKAKLAVANSTIREMVDIVDDTAIQQRINEESPPLSAYDEVAEPAEEKLAADPAFPGWENPPVNLLAEAIKPKKYDPGPEPAPQIIVKPAVVYRGPDLVLRDSVPLSASEARQVIQMYEDFQEKRKNDPTYADAILADLVILINEANGHHKSITVYSAIWTGKKPVSAFEELLFPWDEE